jgi:DNA-binding transcriptional LysR family regulator
MFVIDYNLCIIEDKKLVSLIKQLTLHQLRIYQEVARCLSITRAAENLHLTQPTVSIQMKQLAEHVGLPLLEQVGKRLYLTEAGRELLGVCRQLFDDLARFEMLVSDLQGVKTGQLRLGVITTAKYFIPRLLGAFCERYPGVDVVMKVTNRQRLLQRLENNEDDLYVLGEPPDHGNVWVERFMVNPLVVIAPPTHVLAGQSSIPVARLAGEPFLMREQGSGTRRAMESYFREHGCSIRVRMELGSNEAIKQAVAGGLGLAVLSAHTLALEKNTDELAVLDVEGFPLLRHWHVMHPREKRLSVVAKSFLDFLLQESAGLGGQYLAGLPLSHSRENTGNK